MPNKLEVNGEIVEDDYAVADEFNRYFASIGNNIAQSITQFGITGMLVAIKII